MFIDNWIQNENEENTSIHDDHVDMLAEREKVIPLTQIKVITLSLPSQDEGDVSAI